jgi:hypothetical protein
VKLVNRGKSRDGLRNGLMEVRKRVVELMKSFGDRLVTKYRVMSVERDKETHNNRTPAQDGHHVFTRKINEADVEVVMFKSLPEGEWDLENFEELRVQQTETIDDGQALATENQQEKKWQPWQEPCGRFQQVLRSR